LRSTYLAVRRLVDADLGRRHRPVSPWLAVVPFVLGVAVPGRHQSACLVAAGALALAWLGFIGWRSVRLLKAAGMRAGRRYERDGRYRLSAEYHDTEFAEVGAWRRKLARRKSR